MAELESELKNALAELRKSKERKFNQTVDLIVNLQKFDVKKSNINFFVSVPHKTKDKKIAGFLEVEKKGIESITPEKFKKYSDKKKMKKIVRNFDFFIAQASLMPKVASTFGRVLGPAGKMPSPQLGILTDADDKTLNEIKEKIDTHIRIRAKEASVKVAVGKQNMKDEELAENILAIYNTLVKVLPRGKENVKNLEVKLTMSKPQKIKLK